MICGWVQAAYEKSDEESGEGSVHSTSSPNSRDEVDVTSIGDIIPAGEALNATAIASRHVRPHSRRGRCGIPVPARCFQPHPPCPVWLCRRCATGFRWVLLTLCSCPLVVLQVDTRILSDGPGAVAIKGEIVFALPE